MSPQRWPLEDQVLYPIRDRSIRQRLLYQCPRSEWYCASHVIPSLIHDSCRLCRYARPRFSVHDRNGDVHWYLSYHREWPNVYALSQCCDCAWPLLALTFSWYNRLRNDQNSQTLSRPIMLCPLHPWWWKQYRKSRSLYSPRSRDLKYRLGQPTVCYPSIRQCHSIHFYLPIAPSPSACKGRALQSATTRMTRPATSSAFSL